MRKPGYPGEIRVMRSATTVFLSVLVITLLFFSIVLIESGNVGVRKTLGKVSPEEVTPGLNLKAPMITQITEFVGKEIAIDLTDLTPKAADNLSLRDMDVTVFYKADSAKSSMPTRIITTVSPTAISRPTTSYCVRRVARHTRRLPRSIR